MAQLENDSALTSHPSLSLMLGLPDGHIVRFSPGLEQVQSAAEEIWESLKKNPDGNQWLVLHGLTPAAIQQLDTDHSVLGGIDYRLQWEGTVGLLKAVPSHIHNVITDQITRSIDDRLSAMGIRSVHRRWGATSTYKPTAIEGKQGDQIFLPPSRCPPGQPIDWPTFVIETGVSESMPRLRENAKWWLAASNGAVRIVLIVGIKREHVAFEKWQLAPADAPCPLTPEYIRSLGLGSQGSPRPILIQQPAHEQKAYCTHEVEVTCHEAHGVQGAPMVLEFDALYDTAIGSGQTDVVLDCQDFADITSLIESKN